MSTITLSSISTIISGLSSSFISHDARSGDGDTSPTGVAPTGVAPPGVAPPAGVTPPAGVMPPPTLPCGGERARDGKVVGEGLPLRSGVRPVVLEPSTPKNSGTSGESEVKRVDVGREDGPDDSS